MGGNKINQSGTSVKHTARFEEDGSLRGDTSRANPAVIFFRNVRRAFADFGGMISRAFSNLGDSFRGAFTHVSNAIRGVGHGTAIRNVNDARVKPSDYISRYGDLDSDEDSDSDEMDIDLTCSNVSEKNSTKEEIKKEIDFSEIISPTVIQKLTEPPKAISQATNSLSSPETSEIPLAENVSSLVDLEKSPAEKLFDTFSEGYQASEGFASISPTEPALLDPDSLVFARRYQESHPEHADISYPDDVQKKRKAATALLNADAANRARDVEKYRLAQEAKDKAAERARLDALPAGQADFEDFVSVYNTSAKPYQFVEKSRFLSTDCIRYAEQRLLQSPPHEESEAIKSLLKTAGVSVQESANVTLESGVSTLPGQAVSPPPPPPPPSTPRWMSTLSGILKSVSESRDEMPNAFATMLMPNHGIEERNLAWQGLYLLSSPLAKNSSSTVASENEVALSYQHNSVSTNEDSLKKLELAKQLMTSLQNLNIDDALKGFHVTHPTDEQIKAIQLLKEDASQFSKELESRIKVLSPAKTTTTRLPSKIPSLDSLTLRVFESASADFNTFVDEFSLSSNQGGSYSFDGERLKYLRPACAAIAQSDIAIYEKLKSMTDADKLRLAAAQFMMSEFKKKNPDA
jgi:hypothetical protein